MRKIIIYLFVFILACFFIPVIFTTKGNLTDTTEANSNTDIVQTTQEETASTYNYKNYNEITLYHTSTNTTEKIQLDEYLYGVVSAEMPASFEEEALKAQSVVARTYTLYKIQHSNRKT